MTTPTETPKLTPQFCFSPSALQDFLRASRSSLDDTITANLNALVPPSRPPFDPASTSRRTPPSSSRHAIPHDTCAVFTQHVLFPAWQARSDVLAYCAAVASVPDDDPSERLEERIDPGKEADDDRLKKVDNRGDPYAMRPVVRYGRSEALRDRVENEERVERIIRGRTWGVVGSRCDGGDGGEPWEEAVKAWKQNTSS